MKPRLLQQSNRIWFLQFARAIACLMIVYTHWVAFIEHPNTISSLIKQATLIGYPTGLNYEVSLYGLVPFSFNEAFVSLAIFFLISGYVIPLTIENNHPIQFLARRIMRVFPTLIICLAVTILVIRLGRHLDHEAMHRIFKHKRIWTNFLLIRDFYHESFIENATWTLEIEVHFYVLCFFLAFVNGYKRSLLIILTALSLLCAETWQVFLVARENLTQYVGINASYISVMFMGTSLYNWNKKYWSGKKTLLTILALTVINHFTLIFNPAWIEQASTTYCNDIYALLIFVILLLINDHIPYSKMLDKVAQASYPLYLIHGFTGYTIFYIAFKKTHSLGLSLAIALSLVVFLTIVIHKFIEIPSIRLSKNLLATKKKQPRPIPATESA